MDFKPISMPDVCPILALGIHRVTQGFVVIIENQGHHVVIEAPSDARTEAMLMADDAMDMIDLLLAGDADGAAEVAADVASLATDCAAVVTVNGRLLEAACDCDADEGSPCDLCKLIEVDLVLTADIEVQGAILASPCEPEGVEHV